MPLINRYSQVAGAKPATRTETRPVRLDQLLERLQTAAGTKLGDELYARVAPHLDHEGQLDPSMELSNPPKEPLAKHLVRAYCEQFERGAVARRALPGALAWLLTEFTTAKRGPVDLAAVEKKLGKDLRSWLERLSLIPADAPVPALADRLTYDSVDPGDRKRIFDMAPSIAPRMSGLDFTVRQYGKPNELEGFKFFGLQHLFASTAELFGAIEDLGVVPEDAAFLGKVYSTNFRVAAELEAKGVAVEGVSRDIGTSTDFNKAMGEAIESRLKRIIETLPQPRRVMGSGGVETLEWDEPPKPQVLLIDDGAEAILALHEKFPEFAPFFACVEQTRRGARIAHELADAGKLKCTVVNVAESWAKLERESPMIGQSVVAEVERKLDRLERAGLARPKEATVVGYGAVGQRVAEALMARGITVHVYDKKAERLEGLPAGMVAHTDKHEALSHGAITISCVGERTLFPEDWESLPNGAVLVNAASSDDELGPADLLRWNKLGQVRDSHGEGWGVFQGKPISLGQFDAEAHSDSIVRLESGKELLVASNGFVVNMTGERDPIPSRFIQLTRSLLLMGALTAVRSDKPGLIEVPIEWQQALVAHVEKELKATQQSLQKPLWDSVVEVEPSAPPTQILEAARREKEARARIEQARTEGHKPAHLRAEPKVDLPPFRPPPKADGKVYGYTVGRPKKEEGFSYNVAKALGVPDHDMTVEAWALYHATKFVNQALEWQYAVKFNPDEEGRPTEEQLLAPALNAERAKTSKDSTLFEAQFGNHLQALVRHGLTKRLGTAPTTEQLAEAMRTTAREAGVSLAPWAEFLKANGDAKTAAALVGAAAP